MNVPAAISLQRRGILAAAGAWALLLPTLSHAADEPVDAVKREVEAIVAQFMKRAGAILSTAPTPTVVIEFTPQLSWVLNGAIHEAAWAQCPEDFKAFISSLLGANPPMSPELFFHETFNAFLIPHEMAHFTDGVRGVQIDPSAHFETEIHANRVAVAYWLGEPTGRDRMTRFMQVVGVVEDHLPNPVPTGQDKVKYFNDNYDALGANPAAFGWYQFRMFLDAWELRDQNSFEDLLTRKA